MKYCNFFFVTKRKRKREKNEKIRSCSPISEGLLRKIDREDLFFAQRAKLERAKLAEGNIDESRCWLVYTYCCANALPLLGILLGCPRLPFILLALCTCIDISATHLQPIYLDIKVFTIYA